MVPLGAEHLLCHVHHRKYILLRLQREKLQKIFTQGHIFTSCLEYLTYRGRMTRTTNAIVLVSTSWNSDVIMSATTENFISKSCHFRGRKSSWFASSLTDNRMQFQAVYSIAIAHIFWSDWPTSARRLQTHVDGIYICNCRFTMATLWQCISRGSTKSGSTQRRQYAGFTVPVVRPQPEQSL